MIAGQPGAEWCASVGPSGVRCIDARGHGGAHRSAAPGRPGGRLSWSDEQSAPDCLAALTILGDQLRAAEVAVIDASAEALALGCVAEQVARAAGMSRSTLYRRLADRGGALLVVDL